MKSPRRKRTGYLFTKPKLSYNFWSRRRAAGYWTHDGIKRAAAEIQRQLFVQQNIWL